MASNELFGITWFDVIGSTNSSLAEERSRLPEWSVFAARMQTAGRGQRGNKWLCEKDANLTFSILLKPATIRPARQFAISEAVALGIVRYLEDRGVTARIKWPNDIYCGNLKICGVLVENFLSSAILADSIVGIGLNLNQREFDPSVPNPTSISLLRFPDGGEEMRRFEPEDELPALLEHIREEYGRLLNEPGAVHSDYLDRLYLRNEWHGFIDCRGNDAANLIPTTQAADGRRFRGRIIDVTPEGLLKAELPEGNVETFAFKELRYL